MARSGGVLCTFSNSDGQISFGRGSMSLEIEPSVKCAGLTIAKRTIFSKHKLFVHHKPIIDNFFRLKPNALLIDKANPKQ
jgi:hypothetical protein